MCRTYELYSMVRHCTLDSLVKSLAWLTLSNLSPLQKLMPLQILTH